MPSFVVGDVVAVCGLVNRTEFNGLEATVKEIVGTVPRPSGCETIRCIVQLSCLDPRVQKLIVVKSCNLSLVTKSAQIIVRQTPPEVSPANGILPMSWGSTQSRNEFFEHWAMLVIVTLFFGHTQMFTSTSFRSFPR